MLIGIDGNEANVKNRVGVNTYAFEVLWGLYRLQAEGLEHEFVIYLSSKPGRELPVAREGWKYKVLEGGSFWIIRKLVWELWTTKDKPDVFFSPSHYAPLITRIPQVCSIMDLGYLESMGQFKRYDYWQLRLWSAMSMMVSKCIISISNSTKHDIANHYSRVKKKVRVVHLGYDKSKFGKVISEGAKKRVNKRYAIGTDKYVLFLSTLKPSKNIEGLLTAWSKIEKKHTDVVLVVAGKKGWLFESIFNKAESLGVSERVVFTGFVAEEDKAALISGARCFVLPSFWEGFGLDVLSAMAAGTPVIASDRGSLPEVVGEAGAIVSPDDTDELAREMERLLTLEKSEYNKIVKKGLNHSKKFSWEKTAKETLKILEMVGKK